MINDIKFIVGDSDPIIYCLHEGVSEGSFHEIMLSMESLHSSYMGEFISKNDFIEHIDEIMRNNFKIKRRINLFGYLNLHYIDEHIQITL